MLVMRMEVHLVLKLDDFSKPSHLYNIDP